MKNGSMRSTANKRTFIALDITPSQRLADAVNHWKKELQNDRIKWVNLQQVHLTLTFLGDTSIHQMNAIKQNLSDSLSNYSRFKLRLKGMGIFGRIADPRVFWVGVEQNDVLRDLKKLTDRAAEENGFTIDPRPFNPHITLARPVRVNSRESLAQLTHGYRDTFFMEELISEVVYYESILGREGPKYDALKRFELR